jgi:diguanylate cyclase (GGDEF)-like protein
VNDRLGHSAGDELLRWTAQTLRAELRDGDRVGRVGGDEFAALVPAVDAADVAALRERLVEALAVLAPASVGTALFPDDAETVEDLLRRADRHLYEHKRARPVAEHPALARGDWRAEVAPDAHEAEREQDERATRRRRSLAMCAGTNLVSFLGAAIYALAVPSMPGRMTVLVIELVGIALATGLLLGARRVAASRRWRLVSVLYTGFALAVMTVSIILADGPASAFGPSVMVPVVSVAMTVSPANLLRIGAVLLADYAVIVWLGDSAPPGYVPCFVFTAMGVALTCSTQQGLALAARRALARASRTDGLTSALNRRGLEQRLGVELARARRRGDELVLLTVDLDEFKAVNDRDGHAAGDAMLVWVSARLRALASENAAVGRVGGDEFTLVLPGRTADEAPELAEQVAADLAERAPASVGYASFPADGDRAAAIEAAADRRMYGHKRAA